MIKQIFDIQQSIEALREKGVQRGENTGFKCLDELYSVKQGTFTIVLGAPTHGKSEIIFELLINQASHDKKSIILSPETGNATEIAMELIHKFLKKSAYKTSGFSCTDKEFNAALNWVNHHFAIADDEEKSYSFEDLTTEIEAFEKRNNVKYDLVMAEPWNELDHKISIQENSGRQDLAIEDELTRLRMYCKKNNKHVFLSFHPSHQELIRDKDNPDKSYYPMPKAREAAGGQATLRKAFTWINIWRPPIGLINKDKGIPFLENELIIQIEKSKPKGVGKRGVTSLFYDWKTNRYYEKIDYNNLYAFEHETHSATEAVFVPLQPNINFDKPSDEDDSPF